LFIAFLLSEEGRAIMQADHHPLFEQALADNYSVVPASLKELCVDAETP